MWPGPLDLAWISTTLTRWPSHTARMDIQAVALDLLPSLPALSTLFIWPENVGQHVCFRPPTLASSCSLESLHLYGVRLARGELKNMSNCLPGLVNLSIMDLGGWNFPSAELLREVYGCVVNLKVRVERRGAGMANAANTVIFS